MTHDELRAELRRRLGACRTCGRGIRTADAERVGVLYPTLQRFLRGENVSPGALEQIAAFLEAELRAER